MIDLNGTYCIEFINARLYSSNLLLTRYTTTTMGPGATASDVQQPAYVYYWTHHQVLTDFPPVRTRIDFQS